MSSICVRVQDLDFNIQDEINAITAGRTDIGALVSFTGYVRDFNITGDVKSLTLEHYPNMAEKQLLKIAQKAQQQWEISDITIIHRYGTLYPADQIVLVIAASAHRGDAFNAAEFMMDYLKTQAPFWKKERREIL